MTEIEKTVASDTTGKPAVSPSSVDGHGGTKGITPRDILISTAIVLTQLVQVRVLPQHPVSNIESRSPANIE